MEFFAWVEGTAVGLWVRESVWGFPISLILHSVAMGFLVGVSVLVALRVLGVAPLVPPALLRRFLPVMWISFGFSLLSGLLLLAAYPAKALTNGVFYLKFLFIGLGFYLLLRLARQALPRPDLQTGAVMPRAARFQAIGLLLAWAGAVTAGRLLAYTYSVLTVS